MIGLQNYLAGSNGQTGLAPATSGSRVPLSQYTGGRAPAYTGTPPMGSQNGPAPTTIGDSYQDLRTGLGAAKAAPGAAKTITGLFQDPNFSYSKLFDALGLVGTGLGIAGQATGNKDVATAGQATGMAVNAANAANTLASGGSLIGNAGGYGAMASRLANMGMQNGYKAYGDDAPWHMLHDAGMMAADYYTGGLAELAPMLGKYIGSDNIIGKLLMGLPAFLGPPSVYKAKRYAAGKEAQAANDVLHSRYGAVKTGDIQGTYQALHTALGSGARGAVRSSVNVPADVAKAIGVTPGNQNWPTDPGKFAAVMSWMASDPRNLKYVTGSGDVGYLEQDKAQAVADQAAGTARALLARQFNLPQMPSGQMYDRASAAWLAPQTKPSDIINMAKTEQAYMDQVVQWNRTHPNVQLPAYNPVWIGAAKSLIASVKNGYSDEPARTWDTASAP